MSTMIFLFRLSAIVLLLATVACAQSITRPTPDRYELHIADNPHEHRFDIVLKSNDSRPLCVAVENWPNRVGLLHMGRDLATLQTAAGALPAHDDNFGYCHGGCGEHRIEPHEELHGFIAYEAFGDPVQLAADTSKQLQFSVTLAYCR